jgi:hypothetical protein
MSIIVPPAEKAPHLVDVKIQGQRMLIGEHPRQRGLATPRRPVEHDQPRHSASLGAAQMRRGRLQLPMHRIIARQAGPAVRWASRPNDRLAEWEDAGVATSGDRRIFATGNHARFGPKE